MSSVPYMEVDARRPIKWNKTDALKYEHQFLFGKANSAACTFAPSNRSCYDPDSSRILGGKQVACVHSRPL